MNRRQFTKAVGLSGLGACAANTSGRGWMAVPPLRADTQRTRLTVLVDEPLGKINRNVYGQFTEHLGGCVYDAMWVGPSSKIPNINGLRKGTIEALKRIRVPIIRWPGGCFAESYHWRDGVGPREKRPRRWNLCWELEESNAFGTDEFLEYCRQCGADPYLCFNLATGTVEEALAWMEYCNGKHATAMALLRTANGHPEPYGVRYWGIGNEDYFYFDAEEYARRYALFAAFLSSFDRAPDVEFVACGEPRNEWNQKFFETLVRLPYARGKIRGVHHLSLHHYFHRGPAVNFTDADYYGLLAEVSTLEGYIRKTMGVIDFYTQGGPPIGIAVDEWSVWHTDSRANPSDPTRSYFQTNTLRDALFAGVVLNSFNQFGDRISMANLAQSFNVLQAIALTRGPQFVLTPTCYVYELYQPHMDSMGLKVAIGGPTFKSEVEGTEVTRNYLSASASVKESEHKLFLTLVNQHLTDSLEVEIELLGLRGTEVRNISLRELTSPSVHDENTFDKPNVILPPVEKPVPGKGAKFIQVVPAHSLQGLTFDL